ncbi:MAG TPA: hypothetical protein VH105_06565 [Burkholderiales bacterium]|jgi:hypothetical protein|nr:hypothetical protein [Burkholderiales bacterium]
MLHTEFLLNQRPGVANARAAKQWIREQPVTDARAAHHAVAGLLAELEDSSLPALERLEILETLRPHVAEIDRLYSGRYVAKPLPLGPTERNAFAHAKHLWLRLESAYWHCANAALSGDPAMQPHLALCLARAAGLVCASVAGHVRAGQAIDQSAFDSLQNYFELAQDSHVLSTPVADSLHPKRGTSIGATYRRALLIRQGAGAAAAGRERECLIELAEAWEGKTAMAWRPAGKGEPTMSDLPPTADGARQCVKLIPVGRWVHMLDVTLVSRSLRRRIHKLALGTKPDELRLPASFHHAGVDDLLKRLHNAWCDEANGRAHSRLAAKPGASHGNRIALAHAVNDFSVLYCMVTGEPFLVEEQKDPLMSRRHAEEIFMFQHAARARNDALGEATARQFETWELQDESAGGFRLRRSDAGARLRRGQLASLRLGQGGSVLLAEIRWLTEPELSLERSSPGQNAPGMVEAGLQILHGRLAGIAMRATGINAQGGRQYQPAFLLRVSQSGESGFRVVAPVGWFKPRRVVEVREGEKSYRMMLEKLLQRGVDFEVIEAYMTN